MTAAISISNDGHFTAALFSAGFFFLVAAFVIGFAKAME